MRSYRILFFICVCCALHSHQVQAQNRIIDSLKKVYNSSLHDTLRLNACLYLGNLFFETQPDSAQKYWQHVADVSSATLKKNKLSAREREGFQQFYTSGLADLALLKNLRGDVAGALEIYHDALRVMERMNDKRGMGSVYTNIANILLKEKNYEQALSNYKESIVLQLQSGDSISLGTTYGNMGVAYMSLMQFETGIECAEKGLTIKRLLNDKRGIAKALNTVSAAYYKTGNLEKAESTMKEALQIWEELGDKRGLSSSLYNLARNYLRKKNHAVALQYANRALKLSQELGFPELISGAALTLYDVNKDKGDYRAALENYELHIKMRDSLHSAANKKASIKTQLRYQYEKQAAADSVAHLKETEIKNAELARQKAEITATQNQQYALFGGLMLVIIFAGFMFNRFKITQKQKLIIEKQKRIVEEQKGLVEIKQKEVLDSIYYAKRIQRALITSEKYIENNLNKLKYN